MCLTCMMSEIRDEGTVEISYEMRLCARLINELYDLPYGGAGGPLHIVTDDNNVGDSSLAYCRDHMYRGGPYGPDLTCAVVAFQILWLLERMSVLERAVTVELPRVPNIETLAGVAVEGDDIRWYYDSIPSQLSPRAW